MENNDIYYEKYMKYKFKYLNLLNNYKSFNGGTMSNFGNLSGEIATFSLKQNQRKSQHRNVDLDSLEQKLNNSAEILKRPPLQRSQSNPILAQNTTQATGKPVSPPPLQQGTITPSPILPVPNVAQNTTQTAIPKSVKNKLKKLAQAKIQSRKQTTQEPSKVVQDVTDQRKSGKQPQAAKLSLKKVVQSIIATNQSVTPPRPTSPTPSSPTSTPTSSPTSTPTSSPTFMKKFNTTASNFSERINKQVKPMLTNISNPVKQYINKEADEFTRTVLKKPETQAMVRDFLNKNSDIKSSICKS